MMKKKPTRKYAAGGMAPAQADKVNAANMAAMQKFNAAAKSSAPVQKAVAAASSNKPSDAEIAKIKAALGGAKPNVRPATAVPQKPAPIGASGPAPYAPTTKEKAQYLKGARRQFREDRKSGAQGERSMFQERRKAIQAERASNKAIRKSLKGK
jgi:hypothetical protein